MTLKFQNFPIYPELRLFIRNVYKLINTFPKHELHGLTSQLRRAATSALLNLAEGSMKLSDKEFVRFLLTSIGSLGETVAILDVCLDQKDITPSTHSKFMLQCESLIKKLYAFRKKLNT